MRQLAITNDSWTKTGTMRLVPGFASWLPAESDDIAATRVRRTALTRTMEDKVIPRLVSACVAHPQLAGMVGADATPVDGGRAVQQAQSLLSLRAGTR